MDQRVLLTGLILLVSGVANAAGLEEAISTIRAVGREGEGNERAASAWAVLAKSPPAQLTAILAGYDGADDLAGNWIQTAVDAIVDKARDGGAPLPTRDLERFVADRRHDPRARRSAFEILTGLDASAPDRIIPTMLDDPSVEFRREAVARVRATADALAAKGKREEAKTTFARAFEAARDQDQVKGLASALEKLGAKPDLPRHYGFITNWKLIGPFDNTKKVGFAAVYPPEKEIDYSKKYPGKGKEVGWIDHVTNHEIGEVDLNKAIGKANGVVTYAVNEFTSDAERPVEIRLGCINASKVWLNGELLFGREEYHSGMFIDQYRMKGTLRPGKNVILVKICQNEQTEDWAQRWAFQLRVCDEVGTAVLSTTRPATRTTAAAATNSNR